MGTIKLKNKKTGKKIVIKTPKKFVPKKKNYPYA